MRIFFAATIVLACACVSAQTPSSEQTQATPKFDSARAFAHIKELVAIGPRPAGSAGALKTRNYIKQQMRALGIATTEQPFEGDTPIGAVKMVNVIATIPGPGTGRLIFAGHSHSDTFGERLTSSHDQLVCWRQPAYDFY